MTKQQVLDWVKENKALKEVLDDVAEGTQVYARLLIEHKVTIGELLDLYEENQIIKVGGTDD